jgi:hypothetical protein
MWIPSRPQEAPDGFQLKWWCPISNVYQDEKPAPIRSSLADGKCIVSCDQSSKNLYEFDSLTNPHSLFSHYLYR